MSRKLSRSSALAEFASILGRKPDSLESGLTDSVCSLLADGRETTALALYQRYSPILDSAAIVQESSTREALAYAQFQYGEYSESAPAEFLRVIPVDCEGTAVFGAACPKPYRKPHGPALRPTYASEVTEATAKQQAARAEFARMAADLGSRHRKHTEIAIVSETDSHGDRPELKRERARQCRERAKARKAAAV